MPQLYIELLGQETFSPRYACTLLIYSIPINNLPEPVRKQQNPHKSRMWLFHVKQTTTSFSAPTLYPEHSQGTKGQPIATQPPPPKVQLCSILKWPPIPPVPCCSVTQDLLCSRIQDKQSGRMLRRSSERAVLHGQAFAQICSVIKGHTKT